MAILEFGASLSSALAALIVGIILIFIARMVPIEDLVNKIIYVIGAILVIIGVIFLALYFIGVIV